MTVEAPAPVEEEARVEPARGPGDWVRKNLFNTWYNSLLTVTLAAVILWGLYRLVGAIAGTDFTIIRTNLTLYMVGLFPRSMLWRPALATILIGIMIGLMAGIATSGARERASEAGLPHRETTLSEILLRSWPLIVLLALILAFTTTITPTLVAVAVVAAGTVAYLVARRLHGEARKWAWLLMAASLVGAYLALAAFGGRGWDRWGGLQLNIFLTVAGILFAFPLGLLFALGRRSSLPAVRTVSVAYIEFVRGVPLIALLLFGAFAIGFLVPSGLRPSLVTRMLVAITLFEAAYIAEVVRGGLQAVPKGQVEAAQALGMPTWRTMRMIVLPQALRATIPAMVGQFISLFKDTTLVSVLGVPDLLETSLVSNSQPDFFGKGLFGVTLAFAGLVFWVGSYTMSREARRLERKLGVGER
jgi:general L-amino acid transport system permease protein